MGLKLVGGFIVGFDSDSPNVFAHQADFIEKAAIPTAMINLLTAPPGTRLYPAPGVRRTPPMGQ